jgi:hypothetical protein
MAKTAKQELVEQIDWLNSTLKEFKKAQANHPYGIHPQTLAKAIEEIEAEVSVLQIKLEVMVAVAFFYPHNKLQTRVLTVA